MKSMNNIFIICISLVLIIKFYDTIFNILIYFIHFYKNHWHMHKGILYLNISEICVKNFFDIII